MHKFPCHDCGYDTFRDEYYMVLDGIWNEAVKDNVEFLCIGCLESRLSRKLTPKDFDKNLPVNTLDWFPMSDRLKNRLGYLNA